MRAKSPADVLVVVEAEEGSPQLNGEERQMART